MVVTLLVIYFSSFFSEISCQYQNPQEADECTTCGERFARETTCAIYVDCNWNSMRVQFTCPDYPLKVNQSTAFCELNDERMYFEEEESGNWTTDSIENNQTMESFNKDGQKVTKVICYILYAGETLSIRQDKNVTAECTYVVKDLNISSTLVLSITEDYGDIGTINTFYTTDVKAHLSICPADDAQMNCIPDVDVTIGERVCLLIWADQGIEDIQIVQMSFSSLSGDTNLNIYESCERNQELLIESIFDPEPEFNMTCSYTGVENCPRLRMQCFRVFRFKDEYSMKVKMTLKPTHELNVKKSCNSVKRRKKDINSNNYVKGDEENEIVLSFHLNFNGGSMININKNIRVYQEESPLSGTAFIGILVAIGLFTMMVVSLVWIFKCRTMAITALDTKC